MILASKISTTFTKFAPLNFTVELGNIVKICGGNGIGKTTLITILCGINNIYSGDIYINGYNLRYNQQQFRQNLQVIFAENGLNDALTVKEHLHFFSLMHSGGDLSNAAIKFLELEEYINVSIGKLSSGIKRKVALSRLLICPKKIWIIDEADAYLDDNSCTILAQLIAKRVEHGDGAVFFTAHSDKFNKLVTQHVALTAV
jgi:heme exporter protein A